MLGKAGIGRDGKEAILSSYGVVSSKELSAYELLEICNELDKQSNPKAQELDKWRKRVIASIGGWLKLVQSGNYDINKIKAVACRSAQAESFNKIPLERLRNIYYAFKNKQKDFEVVNVVTGEMIDVMAMLN